MRIVRFITGDGRILLGNDQRDGTATVLIDGEGIFGPQQRERAARELLRGRQALVADDDEGIRSIVAATLTKVGCACTSCGDGAEALDALNGTDFDLVVSDIVMPHHNGYEIFAASKAQRRSRPVVLITGFGYDPGHSVVRASEEGVEGVLYKPFTPAQLIEKVGGALQSSLNGDATTLVPCAERVKIGRLLAPATDGDVFCVGRNYPPTGASSPRPGDLELFMKPRTAVLDPDRAIRIPHADESDPQVDCEGELAVILATAAENVDEDGALDCVLGFTCANDLTATRWRQADHPMAWMRGKGFDTFCPLGPVIVTLNEVDPEEGLEITTAVNGEIVRAGNTRDMIRSVPQLISELSRHITLQPGTVLLTGAPPRLDGGAGPPLKAGDEVCVEIEGVGRLVNKVANR